MLSLYYAILMACISPGYIGGRRVRMFVVPMRDYPDSCFITISQLLMFTLNSDFYCVFLLL